MKRLAPLAALLLAPPPLAAQPSPAPVLSADAYLRQQLRERLSIEEFIAQLLQPIRRYDRDGNGLDADDLAFQQRLHQADARSQYLAEALHFDLDGDMVVRTSEIDAVLGQGEEARRERDRLIERFDTNRDGRVTVPEIFDVARNDRNGGPHVQIAMLLALDPDHDGRLTIAELRAMGEQVFAAADADRDGLLSDGELQAARAAHVQSEAELRQALAERSAATCQMPPVPRGARLIMFGTYSGQGLSTVAVGGQQQETQYVRVTIEPGREPLYLVLTSYELMIWHLAGDVSRVARVVVDAFDTGPGEYAAAGVAGIAADRVLVLRGRCLTQFTETDSVGVSTNVGAIERATGRRPDAVFADHSVAGVALPSGALTIVRRSYADQQLVPVPAGYDPALWRRTMGYFQAGIGRLDAAEVTAPAGAEAYQILPNGAGLAQLVGSGAIEHDPEYRSYRIVRPIPRLPPGLTGAFSAELVLMRGVPMPPGDLGHSCMFVQDTGQHLGIPSICAR